MLRSRTLVSLCVSLVSAAITFAQSPTALSAPVYVTVAFNTAVLQTAEAQHIFSDLQAKFAPRQTHLQQLNAQVEALKKQINDNTASLSDAEKSAKMHTLDTEERQLQHEADDFKAIPTAPPNKPFSRSHRSFTPFCRTTQSSALTLLSLTAVLMLLRLSGMPLPMPTSLPNSSRPTISKPQRLLPTVPPTQTLISHQLPHLTNPRTTVHQQPLSMLIVPLESAFRVAIAACIT